MILRRLTNAIRHQDWFTVIVEMMIVVLGVFIGIQAANWNEAREDRLAEQVIEERLLSEFNDHKARLADLKTRLGTFAESARTIVTAIKNDTPPADREQFLEALYYAVNLGRPPARSATYIQLISSGEFDVLRNEALKTLLVEFDQEIERTSFLYETGADLLFRTTDLMEATESDFEAVEGKTAQFTRYTDFDFERLKDSEGEIEWIYYLHKNNFIAAERLETIVDDIIDALKSAP